MGPITLFPTVYFIEKYNFGPIPRHISIGARLVVNYTSGYIKSTTTREYGADSSEDGGSVASDGGVSLMAGLNLRSHHAPTRHH